MTDLAQLRLRRASLRDAQSIAALHADSWRRHYRGTYSDAFLDGDVGADRLAVWTERLTIQDYTTATIVAMDDEALVGFVHVVFDDDSVWGSLIDNLHVTYARKRTGIGRNLMSEAAAGVIKHGPGGLFLWVQEQNTAAQAFYEALGGRIIERVPSAGPGGDYSRLNGQPTKLRCAWPEASVLLNG